MVLIHSLNYFKWHHYFECDKLDQKQYVTQGKNWHIFDAYNMMQDILPGYILWKNEWRHRHMF